MPKVNVLEKLRKSLGERPLGSFPAKKLSPSLNAINEEIAKMKGFYDQWGFAPLDIGIFKSALDGDRSKRGLDYFHLNLNDNRSTSQAYDEWVRKYPYVAHTDYQTVYGPRSEILGAIPECGPTSNISKCQEAIGKLLSDASPEAFFGTSKKHPVSVFEKNWDSGMDYPSNRFGNFSPQYLTNILDKIKSGELNASHFPGENFEVFVNNVKSALRKRFRAEISYEAPDIELNPLDYVDDENEVVRAYARSLVTGKPVDYESVFRNRYEYDSSIPYSDNDSNIEELKKIKRDYIKNIDDF